MWWYQLGLREEVFQGEIVRDFAETVIFLCSMGNGSPNKACPSDLILNWLQSLLVLLITYSLLMTHILCKRTRKDWFWKKFVDLLSSGTASANGEQLLLILEWQALRALSAFHFEEAFVFSVVHIGHFESCFYRDLGDCLTHQWSFFEM